MEDPVGMAAHCRTFLLAWKEVFVQVARQMTVALLRRPWERWAGVRLPDTVQSLLFVCKGNICRSPMAAVYFQSLNAKAGSKMIVRSAGLETTPGKPAHTKAKAVAIEHHLSLELHTTTQVHAEILEQFDLIVVMEIMQKVRITKLYPHWKRKVVLLGRFDPAGPIEIADPYSGTTDDFRSCFRQMSRCCDVLADALHAKNVEPAINSTLPLSVEKP